MSLDSRVHHIAWTFEISIQEDENEDGDPETIN
jgi:hypothetical protein